MTISIHSILIVGLDSPISMPSIGSEFSSALGVRGADALYVMRRQVLVFHGGDWHGDSNKSGWHLQGRLFGGGLFLSFGRSDGLNFIARGSKRVHNITTGSLSISSRGIAI